MVDFHAVTETRVVDPNYVRGYKTMFSDRFPFLLLSQVRNAGVRTCRLYRDNILEEGESLNTLNKLLKEPLPVNCFRPKYIFGPFLII
ncbi:hypothetical protein RHSIM_Rhsim13G0134500 [Rhododendron simsii]|uniref:Uncharacterized protein n=1 Tax=Rhododendron simsii TaxID=118357 RepID=A0A834L497_RHOSS|nr:hypothetical protein RHSIM_RhsimUnG0177400 [Rhododendron simsii]KAF7120739.1 hypothetical protein RHSIM_Rhsim13G0134500 [Rhododendron simsii]